MVSVAKLKGQKEIRGFTIASFQPEPAMLVVAVTHALTLHLKCRHCISCR